VKVPAAAFLGLLAACGPRESAAGTVPTLPPLQLSPVVPELQQLSAAGPAAPERLRLDRLLDLARTAFDPDGDARLAARSRQSLLEESDGFWALEELLACEQPQIRARAAAALGEAGRQASLVPLLLRLKDEKNPVVRTWLAAALAQLGSGGGLADLVAAMNVAETAQDAGVQAIAILTRAGRDPGEQPSYAALQQGLGELERSWLDRGLLAPTAADPVSDPLTTARLCTRLLLLTGFDLRPVDATRYVLGRCGRLGVPLLRKTALAEDRYLREHSLQIIKQLGTAAADLAVPLLPLLGDAERGSRVEAAATLAALRAGAAAPFLRGWLRDPDVELRTAAAEALGPIGDQAAEPLLRARMDDASEAMDVRIRAAFSIALFERDRPGLRFLRERLQQKDHQESIVRELIDRAEGWR
jgi:HEAT repeat protein